MPGRLWRLSLALLVVVLVADVSAQQAIRWRSNLEAAKQEARQTNRLVLVHYWATWCPACYRMEREVFVDPAVAAAVHHKFIPVKLNFDHYQVDARAMGVTILPTDIVISPNGNVVGTIPGFAEPMQYVASLSKVGAGSRPRPQNSLGQTPVGQSGLNNQPVASQAVSAGQPSVPNQPSVVGRPGPAGPPADYLGDRYAGYRSNQLAPTSPALASPALTSSALTSSAPSNPVQHSPQYAARAEVQRGVSANAPLNINTPSNAAPPNAAPPNAPSNAPSNALPKAPPKAPPVGQNLPGHYSPTPMLSARRQPVQQQPVQQQPVQQQQPVPSRAIQHQATKAAVGPSPPQFGLDGFCPVTLVEKKAWKFGDRRWGAVHLGVTYLFGGLEEQQAFLKTPDRYSPVCNGNDIVVLLDKGQSVPGARRHGVSFAGRIYLFSNQASLDAFTTQPNRYIMGYSQLTQANRSRYGQGLR